MELRVFKQNKLLEYWVNKKLIKTFTIGIGKEEFGHKLFEGDMRTPEGEYKICVKNPESKFYLSLGINYPSQIDAETALSDNRINQKDFDSICVAHKEDKRPPWNTCLGGQIYIHGDLESKSWSEGCIRMFNDDIKFLFDRLEIGTKVLIAA